MSIRFPVDSLLIKKCYKFAREIVEMRGNQWDKTTHRTIAISKVCEQITYDNFLCAYPNMQPPNYHVQRYYVDDYGDLGDGYEVKSRYNERPGYLIQKKAIEKIKKLQKNGIETLLWLYSCQDIDLQYVELEYFGNIKGLIIGLPYSKQQQKDKNKAALYIIE